MNEEFSTTRFTVPPLNERFAKDNIVADLEIRLKGNHLTNQCAEIIRNHPADVTDHSLRSTIRNRKTKVIEHDLIVTKADKGNSVVLLKRSDYIDKMNEFLTSVKAIRNDHFRSSVHNDKVRKCIHDSKILINDDLKPSLLIPNPIPPRLYGLPKMHKSGVPVRPIVSFVSSRTYELSKYLSSFFKCVTNFNSQYSLHNSIELIDKITDVKFPSNVILVSFDVVGVFFLVFLFYIVSIASKIYF